MTADRTLLNILISRPSWFLASDGMRAFGPRIGVRYSYSDVPDDMLPTPNAKVGRAFAAEREEWDSSAVNSAGGVGAFRNVYPTAEMRQFVAELRAAWGTLHVQDNSGLLPDLHQGMWGGR